MFGPPTAGSPNARTIVAATAYQATTPGLPAMVNINITSSAPLSLSAGTNNSADVVIGPTAAVASGTGTVIGKYSNSNSGSLTVGLSMSTTISAPVSFALPAEWYFAVRWTSGSGTITSAFDQSIG